MEYVRDLSVRKISSNYKSVDLLAELWYYTRKRRQGGFVL